jgi:hypothetical protein
VERETAKSFHLMTSSGGFWYEAQAFGYTGILVFVFAPLDAFFQKERPGWFPAALVVAGGLLFIAVGIMLEARE